MQTLLTPKDISFVGYTYKNFDAVKAKHQLAGMQYFSAFIENSIFIIYVLILTHLYLAYL